MRILERTPFFSAAARRFTALSPEPVVSRPVVANPAWQSVILDDLSAVRDLLDQLESDGRTVRELRILDADHFEVRWREPDSTAASA